MLLTLTHARLRIEQGDTRGAAAILRELLVRRPHDREAQALLASLPGASTPHREPARARLERFLHAVTRHAR